MKIAIVGLGLIGGSLGMALKKTDPSLEIIGIDLSKEIIEKAIEGQAIDWGTCQLEDGVREADLVFLASSLSETSKLAGKILPLLKPAAILSDTASTKGEIAREINEIFSQREDVFYVGGHPMAGSEKSGIEAADPFLFENAVYVLLEDGDLADQKKILEDLLKKTGARVLYMKADQHDLVVATISHLPHFLAASLVKTAGQMEKKEENVFKLAAGGFRDVTRIAGSQAELWRDIFFSNKESLLQVLALYKEELEKLEKLLQEDKKKEVLEELEESRSLRELVPAKIKGLLPRLFEIVVTIPDKPGEIGKVANILGARDINIVDIEILRVREGHGGSLRLAFISQEEREAAHKVLKFFDYSSKDI